MEEVEKLWEKDEFPVMGYTLKFSHVVLGYAALLLFAISTTACFLLELQVLTQEAPLTNTIHVHNILIRLTQFVRALCDDTSATIQSRIALQARHHYPPTDRTTHVVAIVVCWPRYCKRSNMSRERF